MPVRVKAVNNQVTMPNGLKREIDVDVGDLIVQVKGGNARGLQGQLEKTTATKRRIAIGYPPDIPNAAWEAAVRNGIPIARNNDELLAIIRELQ
jgi:hypothetical protein